MPGLNGIEATRHVVAALPGVRVLCLSMHSESRLAHAMKEAGAAGYLLKDCSPTELLKAVRRIIQGKTHFRVGESQTAGGLRPPSGSDSAFTQLTDREREVLQLFAEGCTTKEIADRLDVSPKTVSTHREHIMEKLNMRSVAELTKYAVREGITSL
jgi:DNA-binding NarL/FixJ family response regulator